jgi:arsenate reductase
MPITIYHNPKCSTSRKTLDIIREQGHTPKVIPYLEMPPTRDEIVALLQKMKISARDLVRSKEPLYEQLKLHNATDDQLIDAMARHPILINRPIVVTDRGAVLARPQERVKEVL